MEESKTVPEGNGDLSLSRLERLPAEIRNRIYAMVVIHENVTLDIRGGDATMSVSQPAIAATNSNIRKEVLPIFYGANRFLIEIGHADAYDGNFRNYPGFIKQVPHTRLMKRIGAYDPIRCMGRTTKLYACINNGEIELKLEGFDLSWPGCLCFTMREMSGEDNNNRATTMASRLMLACARDLDTTMKLVWRARHLAERLLVDTSSLSSMSGCKRCLEFRKSVRYHCH